MSGLQLSRQSTFFLNPEDLKLGELLVLSGLITQAQLVQTLAQRRSSSGPVGQLLVKAGYLSGHALQAAVDAHCLVKDERVLTEMAIECLKIAAQTGQEFKTVVSHFQMSSDPVNPLGQLLLAASIISEGDLQQAINTCRAQGVPLGNILIANNLVTQEILSCALELQIRVRDKMIGREEAIQSLRRLNVRAERPVQEQPQSLSGDVAYHSELLRLDALLLSADVISPENLIVATKLASQNNKSIEQALIDGNFVRPAMIDLARALQFAVANRSLDLKLATSILRDAKDCNQRSFPVTSAQAEVKQSLSFKEFVCLTGITTDDQLAQNTTFAIEDKDLLALRLIRQGLMDKSSITKLQLCYDLFAARLLSQSQALALYRLFNEAPAGQFSLADGLNKIGAAQRELNTSGAIEKLEPFNCEVIPAAEVKAAPKEVRPNLSRVLDDKLGSEEPPDVKKSATQQREFDQFPQLPPVSEKLINSSSKMASQLSNDVTEQIEILNELDKICTLASSEMDPLDYDVSLTRIGLLSRSLTGTADSYVRRGEYSSAERFYRYLVDLKTKMLGPNHPDLLDNLSDLACIACLQDKYTEAEQYLQNMLGILLQQDQPNALKLADAWSALAKVYFRMNHFSDSELAVLHALQLRRECLGDYHPAVAKDMRDYARVLRKLNLHDRAEKVYRHARRLLEYPEAHELFQTQKATKSM